MTKWAVHEQTHRTKQKHVEYQDAIDIQKKNLFLCVSFGFLFFIYNFLKEMLSYCLSTVTFNWFVKRKKIKKKFSS